MTAGRGGRRRRAPDPARVRELLALATARGYDVAGLAGAAGVARTTARAWLLGQQLPGPAAWARLREQGAPGPAGQAGLRLPDVVRAGLWPGRVVPLVRRPRDQPDDALEILALGVDNKLEGIARPSGRRVCWSPSSWRTFIRFADRQPPPGYKPAIKLLDQAVTDRDFKPVKLSDPVIPPWPFRRRGEPLERSLMPGLEVAVLWPALPFATTASRRILVRCLRTSTRKVIRAVLLDPAQDWISSSKHQAAQPRRNYPSRAMKWRGLAVALEVAGQSAWVPAVIPLHHLITTWDAWVNRDAAADRRPRHDHVDDHAAEFGQRLRELRQRVGLDLSLERAASLARMSPSILSHLESGHADTFRGVAWNLWPLASALRCDPRDLLAPPVTPLLKETDDMPTAKSTRLPYEGTTVPVSKSREQVSDLLRKRGIQHVAWDEQPDDTGRPTHTLRFRVLASTGDALRVRMSVVTPARKQRVKGTSQVRRKPQAELEAEERRIMRVFYFHLKTLFEAADAGIQRIEEVLLAHVEDGGGITVAEHMRPHLKQLAAGHLRLALPAGGAG